MTRQTKMILLTILIVLLVGFGGFFAIWHFFLGKANPSLERREVSITPTSSVSFDLPSSTESTDKVAIDGALWSAELATNTVTQTRGLSYRPSLGAKDAMLFIFSRPGVQSFWMKDMNFPIDMIWIASDGTVAGFVENAPIPQPGAQLWNLPVYSSPDGVDKVLEVNAGMVAKYGIKIGDQVTISS